MKKPLNQMGVLVGALLTLMLIAIPGSANAAGWGPEFDLGSGESVNLATHMNEKGDVTFIAAEEVSTDTFELFSQVDRGDSTQVIRHPITELSGGNGPVDIESGQDGSDRISLLWAEISGNDPCLCTDPNVVYVTRLNQQGSPLSQPLTVVDYSGDDLHVSGVSYAVGADGQAVVGVSVFDPNANASWLEIFAINSDFSSVVKITPAGFGAGGGGLDVATNSSGKVLAAWQTVDGDADTATIQSQFLTRSGPSGSPVTLLSTTEQDDPLVIGTLLGDDGDGTVAYTPLGAGGEEVEVVMVAADGSTLPPTTLDGAMSESLSSILGMASDAQMGLLPDGSALFAFPTADDLSQMGLRTFVVARDGSLRGSEIVAPSDNAAVVASSLGLRPDGSGGVAYSMLQPSEADPGLIQGTLFYRPIDANGAPSGQEVTLTKSAPEAVFPFYVNPLIAANSRGEIAVSWAAADLGTGLLPSAHARIYDAAAPTVSIKAPAAALAGNELVLAADVEDRNEVTTSWNFGDGGTASGEIQSHTFKSPGTYELRVQATDSLGNTATASKQIRIVAEDDADSRRGPNTRITRPPRLRLKAPRAVIRFNSPQKGVTFQCRVGRGPIAGSRQAKLRAQGKGPKGLIVKGKWRRCASPFRLKNLKPALYVVRVRAVDVNGAKDRSPAVVRFRVVKAKSKKR